MSKEKAYYLWGDSDNRESGYENGVDIRHESYEGDRDFYSIRMGWKKGALPNPIIGYADTSALRSATDFPCFTLSSGCVSRRFLDVLKSVGNFAYECRDVCIFEKKDQRKLWQRHSESDRLAANWDYVVLTTPEHKEYLDLEKSEISMHVIFPDRISSVIKCALIAPSAGFPPIFLTPGSARFIVSQKAKDALENAGIKGVSYSEIPVTHKEI